MPLVPMPQAEVLAHAIHTLAVGMAAKQGCSVQTAANLVLIASALHSPRTEET